MLNFRKLNFKLDSLVPSGAQKQEYNLIDRYNSTKILALSFLFKLIVVVAHSSNLVLNLGKESTKISGTFNSFLQNFIENGISRMAVPTLFLISGYLFFSTIKTGSKQEFIDKFKKRFKTLVLPYLFWSLFGILLFFVLQSLPASKPFFTKGLIRDFSIVQWLHTIFVLPIAAQLWFIRDLIVIIVFTPIIYQLLKIVPKLSLVTCFILWFFSVRLYLFSPESLFFFTVGSYWAVSKIALKDFYKIKYSLLWLIVWIALTAMKTLLLEQHIYVKWLIILLQKTSVITGIIAVWYGYDLLYKNDDISKKRYYTLFKYSFWIYVTHQPILNIIKKGLYYFMGMSNWSSLTIYILGPVITLFIILSVGIIMRKYVPKLYFISTGGR